MSSEEQQAETLYETTNMENNIFSAAIYVVRFEKCRQGTFLYLLINTCKDYTFSIIKTILILHLGYIHFFLTRKELYCRKFTVEFK